MVHSIIHTRRPPSFFPPILPHSAFRGPHLARSFHWLFMRPMHFYLILLGHNRTAGAERMPIVVPPPPIIIGLAGIKKYPQTSVCFANLISKTFLWIDNFYIAPINAYKNSANLNAIVKYYFIIHITFYYSISLIIFVVYYTFIPTIIFYSIRIKIYNFHIMLINFRFLLLYHISINLLYLFSQ